MAEAEGISVPTLFGEKTQCSNEVILRALARAVPRPETVVIPRARHPMMREEPVGTCAAVLEFLAEG
jgi:pimeloyl-ACP methyl ester carboxylesterase